MLGKCDNKIISSTTNQWPQNRIIVDDHKSFMASSSTNKVMAAAAADKPNPADPHPLKCPRCDSSNTKFCYYNNYSLSQPRHFCKACKRYWTRGGTLRNVPVGGGCRKNKRPKRHSSADTSAQPQIDMPPPPTRSNPLFYGLNTNPLELNFPFSSFRVSSDDSGFDLHPQINGLGLGFSSGLGPGEAGFKPIQDASSPSPFSSAANNSNFFGSSSFSTASTMASLLASTHKFGPSGLIPYEDPGMGKQVKPEGENHRSMAWNPNPNPNLSQNTNPIHQINSSDPSSLVWNSSSIGAWFDPSTMGSSVPSLI